MHIQFTKESRLALAALLWAKHSKRFCAKQLGFDHSAVIREINRNKDPDGIYRGARAHKKYLERRIRAKQSSRKIVNNKLLQNYIIQKMKKKRWSPEQIAGKTRIVCHETIYQWIYEEQPWLKKFLRCKKGRYRKKRGAKEREKQRELSKRRRINERPLVVKRKERIGDWEGDTIVGKEKTKRILTYVERKSGYAFACKLDIVSADIVERKTIGRFKKIPKSKKHTITLDNGTEFGGDDTWLERKAGVKVYRANPYHSWERGSNENFNGLLREFFPKRTFFANITQGDVDQAIRLLNHRPRKRLNYITPYEVFVKGRWCNSR